MPRKKLSESIGRGESDDKLRAKIKQLAAEKRHLQKQLDDAIESVEKHRSAGFQFPKAKRGKSRGAYWRLVVPDTHGCHIDKAAAAAMLADVEELRPKEVILLGDHADCGGFLAQHHTLNYTAETEYTYEEDIAAANQFLDELQQRAPDADYDYMEGNHERRVEKWCIDAALRNTVDSKYLRRVFGIESCLSLEKRGIAYRSVGKFHDNLPVRGAIRRGKCHFVHGISHAKHAATIHLKDFGGNVVFGHIHRAQSDSAAPVHTGPIGAWCPGCLCRVAQYYDHGTIRGHSHGYHIQYVQPDGEFFPLQIPIINGQSYLAPLIQRVT